MVMEHRLDRGHMVLWFLDWVVFDRYLIGCFV